mmetsp:Transcript_7923/g.29703  ORF Transcript_7923/g.29703 Transcript_7923/m.29703 type:complete len:220 (-) Transcript_7923:10-669(-)
MPFRTQRFLPATSPLSTSPARLFRSRLPANRNSPRQTTGFPSSGPPPRARHSAPTSTATLGTRNGKPRRIRNRIDKPAPSTRPRCAPPGGLCHFHFFVSRLQSHRRSFRGTSPPWASARGCLSSSSRPPTPRRSAASPAGGLPRRSPKNRVAPTPTRRRCSHSFRCRAREAQPPRVAGRCRDRRPPRRQDDDPWCAAQHLYRAKRGRAAARGTPRRRTW